MLKRHPVSKHYFFHHTSKDKSTVGLRVTNDGFILESSDYGNYDMGHKWIARLLLLSVGVKLVDSSQVDVATNLKVRGQ